MIFAGHYCILNISLNNLCNVGHADVMMGFIATNNDALHERLRFLQNGKYDSHFFPLGVDHASRNFHIKCSLKAEWFQLKRRANILEWVRPTNKLQINVCFPKV